MDGQESRTLEAQILNEIAAKDRAIRELQQERDALQRILLRTQRRNLADRKILRSTSVGRVVAEEAIFSKLAEHHPWPVDVTQLWLVAAAAGVKSKATLRSYLHRMKARGLILSADRGAWTIPKDKAARRAPDGPRLL